MTWNERVQQSKANEYDGLKARCEAAEARVEALQRELAEVRQRHDLACGTISAMQDEREQRQSYQVLSALSSWLGSGLGDGSVSAENYEQRIREGVESNMRAVTAMYEQARAERNDWKQRADALAAELAALRAWQAKL